MYLKRRLRAINDSLQEVLSNMRRMNYSREHIKIPLIFFPQKAPSALESRKLKAKIYFMFSPVRCPSFTYQPETIRCCKSLQSEIQIYTPVV